MKILVDLKEMELFLDSLLGCIEACYYDECKKRIENFFRNYNLK